MSTKLERSRRVFLNWLASMVDGKGRKEVSAMLDDGSIDQLINDIIEAAKPESRVVIVVGDGLVEEILVSPDVDIPIQVLNVDKSDRLYGSRWKAYKEATNDPDLRIAEWTFIGTEDGD